MDIYIIIGSQMILVMLHIVQ